MKVIVEVIVQIWMDMKIVTLSRGIWSSSKPLIVIVPVESSIKLKAKATVRKCFPKSVFSKISQYSQENTCAGALFK